MQLRWLQIPTADINDKNILFILYILTKKITLFSVILADAATSDNTSVSWHRCSFFYFPKKSIDLLKSKKAESSHCVFYVNIFFLCNQSCAFYPVVPMANLSKTQGTEFKVGYRQLPFWLIPTELAKIQDVDVSTKKIWFKNGWPGWKIIVWAVTTFY